MRPTERLAKTDSITKPEWGLSLARFAAAVGGIVVVALGVASLLHHGGMREGRSSTQIQQR